MVRSVNKEYKYIFFSFSIFLVFLLFQFYLTVGNVYASKLSIEQSKIQILKEQIKTELNELKKIETKISTIKASQKSTVKSLIIVYSSMSPRKAAAILPHVNRQLAIYILSHMNPKAASSIISRMKTKSAVFFTNSIAGK
ncbi:MAG: MotE family protein [bacterium]